MTQRDSFTKLTEATLQYVQELKERFSFVLPASISPLAPVEAVEKKPEVFSSKQPATPPSPPAAKESSLKPSTPAAPAPVTSLSAPKPSPKDPMDDLRAACKKIAPTLKILDRIPSDAQAKKIKNTWKDQLHMPDIAVLRSQQMPLAFLEQIAKAIDLYFFPCRVIDVAPLEKANSWDSLLATPHLKFVIAPDATLWGSKELMRHYHEIPSKKERFLGKIPLLLLPDPNLYLKDPSLKRSLWNLLCHVLQPLKK